MNRVLGDAPPEGNLALKEVYPDSNPAELRIALFSGNYNYVTDGANRALNRLVAYLERQGAVVRVYAPTTKTPAFPPAGTLISVPSVPIPFRSEYRLALGLPRSIRADLAAFGPTLVHLSAPDLLGHAALRQAEKWGIPAVASLHTRFDTYMRYYHLGWIEPTLKRLQAAFYRRCARVYAPTRDLADELQTDGVDDVGVWARGVDLTLFNPTQRDLGWRLSLGFAPDDCVIAFVGRLVKEKGLDVLVGMVEALRTRGIRPKLLIVGDGPEREWLERRLPEAHFTGHLNATDLARAYASSDVFVNPSVTESFGNVTLEAMASSLALVCARATGNNHLVDEGINGYLCPPKDVHAFADRLAQLIATPTLRAEMGRASRKKSLNFDWDRILGGLLADYRRLLHRNTTLPPQNRGPRLIVSGTHSVAKQENLSISQQKQQERGHEAA